MSLAYPLALGSRIMPLDVVTDASIDREIGDLEGLKQSLTGTGQIHNIVIDTEGRILAGRRRYFAMRELGWKEALFLVVDPKDPFHSFKFTFDENTVRKSYTDPEMAAQVKVYHELKVKQFGEITQGERSDLTSSAADEVEDDHEKWSKAKTADELGVSRSTVIDAIKIAEAVEEDPSLAGESGRAILRTIKRDEATKKALETHGEEPPADYRSTTMWHFADRDLRYGTEKYEHGVVIGQAIEILLWLYTNMGDVVVDFMAGGGTVMDVAKRWKREVYAYDIHPIRDEIEQWDIRDGIPPDVKENSADFIFLDPPYFNMKVDVYENVDEFVEFSDLICERAYVIAKDGSFTAYIIMDYGDGTLPSYNDYRSLMGIAYESMIKAGFKYIDCISMPLPNKRVVPPVSLKKTKRLSRTNRLIWIFKKEE